MPDERIIVCPFDQKLISSLQKKAVVVHTRDQNLIKYITREVSKENTLHAIRLHLDFPLSELQFEDDWRGIPLLIVAREFGEFKDLIHQMNLLRQLNARIFLGPGNAFNFTGLQILSSLQISCGLIMDEDFASWEETNDLMHYTIYGRTNHAPIEPFNYIASHYGPRNYLEYNTVYFNNPEKYLHLNESGQVALTASDLMDEIFIAEHLDALDIENNEGYQKHVKARHDMMLTMNDCTFCPAFRICLGKFSNTTNKDEGCKKLFTDMMEAADFYKLNQSKNNGLWQW